MTKRKIRTVLFAVLFLLGMSSILLAQAEETASRETQVDSLREELQEQEIIMEEILIEGVVEKPNVTILPSRKETEFGEIDFINRSFTPELQSIPQRALLFDERWNAPVVTEKLRGILSQNKKKFIREY